MNHWNLCVVNGGVPVAIEFCATQDNTHVWGLLAAVKWSEVWCLSMIIDERGNSRWGVGGEGGSAVGLQRSQGFSGIRRAEQVLWCSCQVWGEEQLADCSSRSAGQRMWRWSPPRVTLIVSGLTRSLWRSLIQQQGHIFRRERSCGYRLMKRMTKKTKSTYIQFKY